MRPRVLILLLGLLLGAPLPLFAQQPAASIEYYHLDALGSVRAVTNHAGVEIRRHEFLPFGEEWIPEGSVPAGDVRLFTGHERDHETGLDYFGARYYRAEIGRFTTIDPLMTIKENLVDPQRWTTRCGMRTRQACTSPVATRPTLAAPVRCSVSRT